MNDLTDVATLKEYLKIVETDVAADNILKRLVSAASDYFLSQVNRGSFLVDTYTERRDGKNCRGMLLLHYPVQSIVSLVIDGVTIPDSLDGIQPGYILDQYGLSLVGYRFWPGRGNVIITYTAGYPNRAVTGENQMIPAQAPFVVGVNLRSSFTGQSGVSYAASGLPLAKVAGVPIAGQYSEAATGDLTFSADDQGQAILISYQIDGIPYDVEQAVIELAALKYRSKNWIGERSQSNNGVVTVSYSNSDVMDEVKRVINQYRRVTLLPQ